MNEREFNARLVHYVILGLLGIASGWLWIKGLQATNWTLLIPAVLTTGMLFGLLRSGSTD